MKLFKKIYVQAAIGMLLLSVWLLGWLLYETQKESLQDVIQYEVAQVNQQMQRFREAVQTKKMAGGYDSRTKEAVAAYHFRTIFGLDGALFLDGEEQYNRTPYTYDIENLRGIKDTQKQEDYHYGLSVSDVQTVDGKKLLLFFYGEKNAFMQPGETCEVVVYKDVTDIYARTRRLLEQGVLATVLALLLVGVFLYGGLYRTLRPLLELKKAAMAIAGGAYQSRVHLNADKHSAASSVRSGCVHERVAKPDPAAGTPQQGWIANVHFTKRTRTDEIDALAESFDQMAERVEEHLRSLKETNEKQRRLLGSLAHELKTPLTAIIGYSETLMTVQLAEKNRVRALNYIHSEGKRLARLSEKMLELTGLYESAEHTLELQETEVLPFLRKLKDLTAFRCQKAGMRLELSCKPGVMQCMDADLMMSLLMNLVDNACKASADGGVIRVIADERRISVCDEGKGIPEEEIAHVTEAFYMVDKSRAKTAGSVGLGLALCAQIAAMHGASLRIESEEGHGTEISVVF